MMDPNIQNIILGIIANGLTSFIAYFGRKGGELVVGKELRKRIKVDKTSLQPILNKAVKAVSESIDLIGHERMEEISLFLTSPEVEAVVRQIYSGKLLKNGKKNSLKLIQKEFLTTFSLFMGIQENKLAASAKDFLDALIEGAEKALTDSIDEGILSAHEAKSSLRHRILLDEISAIGKNLEFLNSRFKPTIKSILEFEEKYRQQMGIRHGHIIPPHFDEAQRKPIDSLFVSPNFNAIKIEKDKEYKSLGYSEFLYSTHRTVILGNPGGGKSTFTYKLCSDLSLNYSDRLFAGRLVTPILVVLRDYGAEKKESKCSILQFIESKSNSFYQIQPLPGAFEYLLLNGRAIVIFDGLDELLDTSYRREISGDIEAFCNLYPSAPVLVTSREIGYEQAPLDQKKFEVFKLSPFEDDQVNKYVVKWFALDSSLSKESQKQKAEAFMNESGLVSDLRSNPLMLALMCNIYRGENYIPRNRPDVYEKCALMLFERWDKSRGIQVHLPIEFHIRPTMMFIAHWIYSDEKLQGGVTEEKLVEKTADYLCEKRFEDRDEAKNAANEFIRFCRGRAWVFTDTGTTKEGIRLYQFTHRTFLEYFTAAYLVRTNPTADQLNLILFPRIARGEWDIVAQQAFQILNKNVEGASDELLISMIEEIRKKTKVEWSFLSFAIRVLEFIVPTPKTLRDITIVCIYRFFEWGLKIAENVGKHKSKYREIDDEAPISVFGALLHVAIENRKIVSKKIEDFMVEKINNGNEEEASLAIEIGFTLHIFIYKYSRTYQGEIFDYWRGVQELIIKKCSDRIKRLSPKFFWTCYYALGSDIITIDSLISWYGFKGIFLEPKLNLIRSIQFISIAESKLRFLSELPDVSEEEKILKRKFKILEKLGNIFLSSFPQLLKEKKLMSEKLYWVYRKSLKYNNKPIKLDLNNDGLFAIFFLFAIYFESLDEKGRHTELIYALEKKNHPLFHLIVLAFLSRLKGIDKKQVQEKLTECVLSDKQQAFIWQWIRKEINLLN